jgi:hypothetical protein
MFTSFIGSITRGVCFVSGEAVEKPGFQRLMENAQMQGFRNPDGIGTDGRFPSVSGSIGDLLGVVNGEQHRFMLDILSNFT